MGSETLRHYVEFYSQGLAVTESSARQVETRDPSAVQAPTTAFGYAFFDRQEYTATDGEVLVGAPRNRSGTHYFGKAMSLADVAREVPNSEGLQENMTKKGWDKVVKTRSGTFHPLGKNDVIVAER